MSAKSIILVLLILFVTTLCYDHLTIKENRILAKPVAPTKKSAKDSLPEKSKESVYSDGFIFEKVERQAFIDQLTWRQFLEKYLPPVLDSAVEAGLEEGCYKVHMRFTVEMDGTLSNIHSIDDPKNDPGFGLVAGFTKIMKDGPLWHPGLFEGREVRSYHVQPITCIVMSVSCDSLQTTDYMLRP